MEELVNKLKAQIIEQLNLEDVNPDEVKATDSLFDGGLGLDSIDALELIVLLDKDYGVKVASPEEGKEAFESLETMAKFILSRQ